LGTCTLEADVIATVTTVPRPFVTFEIDLPPLFGFNLADEAHVTLLSTGTEIPCRILKGQMISTSPSTISLRPLDEVTRGALDAPVPKIVFAIPNFPDFIAHAVIHHLPNGGGRREDEIRLPFLDWIVTIRKTSDIAEREERLGDEGGFGITAVGVMEKQDGRSFRWADAEPLMEPLRVFLSFVCGRWTGPMLPAGIGATGEIVWFRWSVPLAAQGFSVFTWFDTHRGMTLSDIFPAFVTKCNDPLWKETISCAIYWFVRANSAAAGTDGSLILSQAALEILSWTCLVKSSGMSKSKFKGLPAAESIRQLLVAMGIPATIPSSLSLLQGVSADGPGAIAAVRNNLVHPEKDATVLPATEAWTLAQRYIELVLLRLCGFNGEHANRTVSPRWVGQVERVPWA
jgi:hypothetical protein